MTSYTSGFTPSLIIPEQGAFQELLGWEMPPLPTEDPLVTQPADEMTIYDFSTHPAFEVAISASPSTAIPQTSIEHLRDAINFLGAGNVKKAGEKFREARRSLHEAGNNTDQYCAAAFAEALFAPSADIETYEALDRIRQKAADTLDSSLSWQERLVRTNLVLKLGGDFDVSLGLLHEIFESVPLMDLNSTKDRHILIQALTTKLDIFLQKAVSSSGKMRVHSFKEALKALSEIDNLVNSQGGYASFNSPIESGSLEKELAAGLHIYTAGLLRDHGFTIWARDTGAATIRANEDPSLLLRISAAAREGLAHSDFADNEDALIHMMLGGVAAVAAVSLTTGVPPSSAAMEFFGAGATLAYGLGKGFLAATAEETRQAWKTGHSDKPLATNTAIQAAKIAAAYAFFGGMVPGVGALQDVPMLGGLIAHSHDHWGQIHGIGSVSTGLLVPFFEHGNELVHAIGQSGVLDGTAKFWSAFSQNTVFGASLKAGLNVWTDVGIPENSGQLFSLGDPWSVWRTASVLWAAATMVSSDLRSYVHRKAPTALTIAEALMLPAMFDFAIDMGTSLDVKSFDAKRIAAIGMGMQLLYHAMSGGKLRNADISNVGRGAVVEQLYAGVGSKMVVSMGEDPSFSAIFSNSMGIQVGLVPIMVAHGLLLKWNMLRTMQNKGVRSFSAESLGNFFRLLCGWATWQGTLISGLLQAFVQSPWMTRVVQEPAGSGPQRGALHAVLQPLAQKAGENDADYRSRLSSKAIELRQQAQVAGRRWRFWAPLTGKTLVERLPMFLALAYVLRKKPEQFSTKPEEFYYRMIYRALTDKGSSALTEPEVAHLLEMSNEIARDTRPEFRDISHNLITAIWAARNGVNGQKIRDHFGQNNWVFDHYGVTRDENNLPPSGFLRQVRWFKKHLIG